jgi:hypothetical protein
VGDDADEKKALIDIPLSFTSDQPSVPGAPDGRPTLPVPMPVSPK